jgi:hypothetical protein
MSPINVGIITGTLFFIALLQGSIIVSGQSLSQGTLAAGQNLYTNINIQGISGASFFFGALCAILEIVWPGTVKQVETAENRKKRWESEGDEEMSREQQESLDEFDRDESTD